MKTPDYRKAYEAAERELAELLEQQQRLEKRLLIVRESIQTLAALCESEGIGIDPSPEASYMLVKVTLADEIRMILRALFPLWLRPNEVKNRMARLGHDMSKYQNPQATIHMVLKRMVNSGEVQETTSPDGKKAYRCPSRPTREAAIAELERRDAEKPWVNVVKRNPLETAMQLHATPTKKK